MNCLPKLTFFLATAISLVSQEESGTHGTLQNTIASYFQYLAELWQMLNQQVLIVFSHIKDILFGKYSISHFWETEKINRYEMSTLVSLILYSCRYSYNFTFQKQNKINSIQHSVFRMAMVSFEFPFTRLFVMSSTYMFKIEQNHEKNDIQQHIFQSKCDGNNMWW